MTDLAALNAHTEYLTRAQEDFTAVQTGRAWSVACSKWIYTPAMGALPDELQDELWAMAEATRLRVNKPAGA